MLLFYVTCTLNVYLSDCSDFCSLFYYNSLTCGFVSHQCQRYNSPVNTAYTWLHHFHDSPSSDFQHHQTATVQNERKVVRIKRMEKTVYFETCWFKVALEQLMVGDLLWCSVWKKQQWKLIIQSTFSCWHQRPKRVLCFMHQAGKSHFCCCLTYDFQINELYEVQLFCCFYTIILFKSVLSYRCCPVFSIILPAVDVSH